MQRNILHFKSVVQFYLIMPPKHFKIMQNFNIINFDFFKSV